ncbi:MAG: MBL fold metallo-hydrolase [Butyrivibrio sp.]|nr:MBL fold metallo-hydrolase [Butyrivibrio sp.]
MAEVIKIDDNTWRFEDGFVRFFLVEGDEKAAMIDSGVNCPNALEMAKELTDKPVILINTHGDGDHTSGTNGFSHIYIHPSDFEKCEVNTRYPGTELKEIKDGDVIDLGNRPLKIIHIPGHTSGSVAVLDVKKRALFAGDSVQKGHIFMFGNKREPENYEASLEKLASFESEYDLIYASHDECILPKEYVEKVKEAWKLVNSGEVPFEIVELYGNKVRSYTTEYCGFYLEDM